MENNRKRYIFSYWVIFIFVAVGVLYYCNVPKDNVNKQKTEENVGEFVYMDIRAVLHTKNGCTAVFKENGAQPVIIKKKSEIKKHHLQYICSQCVTDKQYIVLKALALSHEIKDGNDFEDD